MKAIIDADIIKYYCAGSPNVESRMYKIQGMESPVFGYKKDAVEFCEQQEINPEKIYKYQEVIDEDQMYEYADSMIDHFCDDLGTTDIELYIGGKGNFRNELYPEYKHKRKDMFQPLLKDEIHSYLVGVYGAIEAHGMEADDAVAIRYNEDPDNHILCSNDKDLDQVPGYHYCTKNRNSYFVDPEAAQFLLYKQIISGDATDNIPGARGYGPKKAEKALEGLETEKEMWEKALDIHGSWEQANLTAQLVYILRHQEDTWIPPK